MYKNRTCICIVHLFALDIKIGKMHAKDMNEADRNSMLPLVEHSDTVSVCECGKHSFIPASLLWFKSY